MNRSILVVVLLAACSLPASTTTNVPTTSEATVTTTTPTTSTADADTTAATISTTAVATGTYTAGNYTLNDVQVSEDVVGDFEVRTRATNNGSDKSFVSLTATIFRDGSVVATASSFVSDWAAGETLTVEFISVDDYGDWDAIEFQVDSEL